MGRFKAAEIKFMSRTGKRDLLESRKEDILVEIDMDLSKRN
jgi:hypothetical protein